MAYNTCRLCKDDDLSRDTFRYGIRHYCHAECGFSRWGDEFLTKIPAHEIGQIPYRLILDTPERRALASKLCPLISGTIKAAAKNVSPEWAESTDWLRANKHKLKPDSTR